LRQGEHANQDARRLFAHILHAEQVWLTRLQGSDSSHITIWPDIELSRCAELVRQNGEGYTAFLAGLPDTDTDRVIDYTNQSGKAFQTSIRDILTHVGLHGQYHRGQINSKLRASGVDPAGVDYILFVR
jgi:uncharacterized damage-inducible protein DinB